MTCIGWRHPREDSFKMDSMRDFKAFAEDLIKRKLLPDMSHFNSRIIEQIKNIMRNTLLVTKSQ